MMAAPSKKTRTFKYQRTRRLRERVLFIFFQELIGEKPSGYTIRARGKIGPFWQGHRLRRSNC